MMRGPPRAPQQCQCLRFFPVSELGMRWLERWGHGDEAPTCPQLEDGREQGGGRIPASPTGPGSCTGWMLSPSFLSPNSLVLSVGCPLLSTLYPSLLPPSRLPQHRGWVGWGLWGPPPALTADLPGNSSPNPKAAPRVRNQNATNQAASFQQGGFFLRRAQTFQVPNFSPSPLSRAPASPSPPAPPGTTETSKTHPKGHRHGFRARFKASRNFTSPRPAPASPPAHPKPALPLPRPKSRPGDPGC